VVVLFFFFFNFSAITVTQIQTTSSPFLPSLPYPTSIPPSLFTLSIYLKYINFCPSIRPTNHLLPHLSPFKTSNLSPFFLIFSQILALSTSSHHKILYKSLFLILKNKLPLTPTPLVDMLMMIMICCCFAHKFNLYIYLFS